MPLTHPVCKWVAVVWGAGCGVSWRGETSRLNVGELKCNYQAITNGSRLGKNHTGFFFFCRGVNLISISTVIHKPLLSALKCWRRADIHDLFCFAINLSLLHPYSVQSNGLSAALTSPQFCLDVLHFLSCCWKSPSEYIYLSVEKDAFFGSQQYDIVWHLLDTRASRSLPEKYTKGCFRQTKPEVLLNSCCNTLYIQKAHVNNHHIYNNKVFTWRRCAPRCCSNMSVAREWDDRLTANRKDTK